MHNGTQRAPQPAGPPGCFKCVCVWVRARATFISYYTLSNNTLRLRWDKPSDTFRWETEIARGKEAVNLRCLWPAGRTPSLVCTYARVCTFALSCIQITFSIKSQRNGEDFSKISFWVCFLRCQRTKEVSNLHRKCPTGFLVVVVDERCCCIKGKIATLVFDELLNFTLVHLELSLLKINVK